MLVWWLDQSIEIEKLRRELQKEHRFSRKLIEHCEAIERMFNELVEAISQELPLAYQVTKASSSGVMQMRPILNEYNAKHSGI